MSHRLISLRIGDHEWHVVRVAAFEAVARLRANLSEPIFEELLTATEALTVCRGPDHVLHTNAAQRMLGIVAHGAQVGLKPVCADQGAAEELQVVTFIPSNSQ